MNTVGVRHLVRSDGDEYRSLRLVALEQAPEAFGSTVEAEAARSVADFEHRLADAAVFGASVAGAIALYEKAGFVSYGVEPRSLKTPSRYFAEVLMVRFLR